MLHYLVRVSVPETLPRQYRPRVVSDPTRRVYSTTSFSRIAPLQWSLSMEDAAQQLRENPETSNDEILVAIASARRIIDETTLLSKLHAEDPVGFGNFTAHIPALKAALESAKKKLSPDLRDNSTS